MNQECCQEESVSLALNRKLQITLTVFLLVLCISYIPLEVFERLNESLVSYVSKIWWAIALGLVLGGIIEYFVPREFIAKYLGQQNFISLLYAVFSGFLLSACSHGILALSMQFHKKGASNAAVITFLLAAPWANLPVTLLLFGFFGWQATLFIGAAMCIAFISGSIFLLLERINFIETSPDVSAADDISWNRVTNFDFKDSVKGVASGTVSLANMVLWWILIGFLAAAIIGAYVPEHVFMDYFGPTFTGLMLTLLVATVIEVCSEGSAPIAFEIFNQVGTLGNPFVFLMAGVVTDYTEIGLLWSNIGPRVAIWLVVVTVPQVLFVGYLFNQLA